MRSQAAAAASAQLPYTGAETLVIAMIGAGFLLGGAGLRISVR
jgi:LPXTG-motif cell wall-anchored protein